MTERDDVLMRDVARLRTWLKERYPQMTETERERLIHHLVEVRSFLHMLKYGKRPDDREYVQ
jgi:dsDNA-binding SOS-regulon protein